MSYAGKNKVDAAFLARFMAKAEESITEYVTDKASGRLLGAIGRWNGKHVVASYLDGDMRDHDSYVILGTYRSRKAARAAAPEKLNDWPGGARPVNIAAIL